MNDIIIREVKFYEDSLLVVKKDNKIHVGVSYICNGIGLTRKKADYEIERIQNDIVLKKGSQKISVPSNGGLQDSICIELDYLPLWLAKINVNIIRNEDARNKLIKYQLKVKDVLSEAFIENKVFEIPKTYSETLKLASSLAEQAEKYQLLMSTINAKDMDEVVNILKIPNFGRNKMFKWLRQKSILMDGVRKNIPYAQYSKFFEVIEVICGRESKSKTLVKPEGIDFILKLIEKEKRLLEAVN